MYSTHLDRLDTQPARLTEPACTHSGAGTVMDTVTHILFNAYCTLSLTEKNSLESRRKFDLLH